MRCPWIFVLLAAVAIAPISPPAIASEKVSTEKVSTEKAVTEKAVTEKSTQPAPASTPRASALVRALPPVNRAIVQLKTLDLAKPTVSGDAQVTLQVLPNARGVFTLELRIGDRPATFLLDTGASTTLLSRDLRQRLNLSGEPVPSDRLDYAVAGKDCPTMTATRLAAPPLQIPAAPGPTVQITGLETLQFEQTLIPTGADGVLGMDVLGQFDFVLEPTTLQLSLQSPPSRQPLSPRQQQPAIPLRSRSGVMLASLLINDQGPFEVLLDTAADSTFISESVAERLGLGDRQPIEMLGFCGLEPAARTRLTRVALGTHSQTNLEAIITQSSVLTTLGIDGVLGQNFLNAYQQRWHLSGEQPWLHLETAKSTKDKT